MHLMLTDLFNWHLTAETSGWAPINILHRMMRGEVGGSGRAGHKVLCREMSIDQLRTQKAYNSLNTGLKIVVCAKHMGCPLKEDGMPQYKKWGDVEKAHYLTENVSVFRNEYKKALRVMEKRL